MRTLLLPFVVLALLIAAFLVGKQVNQETEQNQIRQIQEEARERRKQSERKVLEFAARLRVERDAQSRKREAENAEFDAFAAILLEPYRTPVQNAYLVEARRREYINKAAAAAFAATPEGQVEAYRKALDACYVERRNQLRADYSKAMEKGDRFGAECAKHWMEILDEVAHDVRQDMKTLTQMSRDNE
jgi:hypothetical protein